MKIEIINSTKFKNISDVIFSETTVIEEVNINSLDFLETWTLTTTYEPSKIGETNIFGVNYYDIGKILYSLSGFDELNNRNNHFFVIENDNIIVNINNNMDNYLFLFEKYNIPILIDYKLNRFDLLWASAGHTHWVFPIKFNDLIKLTNGTVISDQTSTGLESSISDEGNDWYRISMKFTTSANEHTSN